MKCYGIAIIGRLAKPQVGRATSGLNFEVILLRYVFFIYTSIVLVFYALFHVLTSTLEARANTDSLQNSFHRMTSATEWMASARLACTMWKLTVSSCRSV